MMNRFGRRIRLWVSKVFIEVIRGSLHSLRDEILIKHSRSLPVGDILMDRWDVARFNRFGQGTSCYSSVLVIGSVTVGENCWIGPNVVLDGSGELEIGNNVQISAGAQLYSHNSVLTATSLAPVPISRNKTIIGNNVYIGPNAIIEQGVKIGNHAIIGALSLVNKDVPDFGKYLGTKLQK
jgi:acetyltransferase-like isoleucine patch superfamily enzyme